MPTHTATTPDLTASLAADEEIRARARAIEAEQEARREAEQIARQNLKDKLWRTKQDREFKIKETERTRRIAKLKYLEKHPDENPYLQQMNGWKNEIGLSRAIEAIEKKGFKYIKLELEANIDRNELEYYEHDEDCDGDCDNDCNGSERDQRDQSDNESLEQIKKSFVWHIHKNAFRLRDRLLTYCKFYNDGSVDTETTLTLPIREYIFLPAILKSFSEACAKHAQDPSTNSDTTENAGMHIALLKERNYPCQNKIASEEEILNFKRSIEKLSFALTYLSSPDKATRSFHFRKLRVGIDTARRTERSRDIAKYSAIYLKNKNSIEYRIFDTCYQHNEGVFDYLKIIAATLEFLDSKAIDPEILKNGKIQTYSKPTELKTNYERERKQFSEVFDTSITRERLIRELIIFYGFAKKFKNCKLDNIRDHLFTFSILKGSLAKERLANDIITGFRNFEYLGGEIKTAPTSWNPLIT